MPNRSLLHALWVCLVASIPQRCGIPYPLTLHPIHKSKSFVDQFAKGKGRTNACADEMATWFAFLIKHKTSVPYMLSMYWSHTTPRPCLVARIWKIHVCWNLKFWMLEFKMLLMRILERNSLFNSSLNFMPKNPI